LAGGSKSTGPQEIEARSKNSFVSERAKSQSNLQTVPKSY